MITKKLTALPLGFLSLEDESTREGFHFLKKLRIEWDLESCCFDGPGEALYGVFEKDRLVAIGGITADPEDRNCATGRIHHVYVRREYRNQGIGSGLIHRMISESCLEFSKIRLVSKSNEAARFYESLGFCPVVGSFASHEFDLVT